MIQQYIYTRLSKDESPRNKLGFQSAFIPEKYSDRGFILELESRIHVPEHDTFTEKNIVFYRELGGEIQLIILWMRILPDARDEQGRAGIFMVHGFIIPQAVHQLVHRPLSLMQLLEKHLFFDREDILASPMTDLKTGFILPLDISKEELAGIVEVPGSEPELWEKQLLSFQYKQVRDELEDWALAIKGAPRPVEQVFNRLAGFQPLEIRLKMGWDPAFDGGKIFFSPFKTFGYSKAEPVTGRPLIFDLDSASFMDSVLSHQLLVGENAYDQFLKSVLRADTSQDEIDRTYTLCMALMAGEGVPDGYRIEGAFASTAEGLVGDFFVQLATKIVGRPWALAMRESLDYASICQAMNGQMAMNFITKALERTILHQGYTKTSMPNQLEDKLVNSGPARLQLLHSMWTEKDPDLNVVKNIPPAGLFEAFRLMATSDLVKEKWFFTLLANFPQVFGQMLADVEFRGKAEKWLKKQVPRSHRKMRDQIVTFMIDTGRLSEMGKEEPDWYVMLEEYLKGGKYDSKELSAMVGIAKREGFDSNRYPMLKAFSFPGESIPSLISGNHEYRGRFARALVVCHGYSKKALRAIGFSEAEIVNARNARKGFVTRLMGLFGR